MESLWSRWPEIQARILESRHTILFLDYDGTLTPIVAPPEDATLPAATRALLDRLSRAPSVTVTLISGRPVRDLRRLVGVRRAVYIGNHGLEMWRSGQHALVPIPGACRVALQRARRRLAALEAAFPGSRVEDKGLSVSLHYRLLANEGAARLRAAFARETQPFVDSGALEAVQGKKVLDLRPNVHWTKGDAALSVIRRARRGPVLAIYVGDDRTDEDAFAALSGAITIRVGRCAQSKARFYVRDVRGVVALLARLAAHVGDEARVADSRTGCVPP
jgi:trehalose-phosphatase